MSAERPVAKRPTVNLIGQVPVRLLPKGAAPATYQVLLSRGLESIDAAEWDRLLEIDDAPLLSWNYLEGLERSGCVGGMTSWQPAHLLVRKLPASGPAEPRDASFASGKPRGELVAAAPAYLKYDSDGEWVYDLDWAAFAESKGCAYYPKLVLAVPFNPVSGGRLLTRPDLDELERAELRLLLLEAAKRLCQTRMKPSSAQPLPAPPSSAHVLFPRFDEPALSAMAAAGFLLRQQEQYHFLNFNSQAGRPYRDFDDFLAQMRSHRRTAIRRERRALGDAGITVRTYRGLGPGRSPGALAATPGFTPQELGEMFELYAGTSLRYTGTLPYLNRRFFELCAERLGDRLELVLAHDRDGVLVGGAWNLRGDRRLYGRHWGQRTDANGSPEVPFLHFEVCYYHSIERCIDEKLEAFEPGHGGEHKLIRGFTPILTHSAHYLREAKLRLPIAAFLAHEAPLVEASLREAAARCPLRFSPEHPLGVNSPSRKKRKEPQDPDEDP